MKRAIAMILVLLLLAPAALAERIVYADQGGVRVYEEGGRLGLLDAGDDVLLEARYDGIEPFAGDYSVASLDGRQGVIRRDGSTALECAWAKVSILSPHDLAVAADNVDDVNPRRVLIDLATGETRMDGEGHALFYADDAFVYRLDYDYNDPFELVGPFTLTVYDGGLNPLLTMDGACEADFFGWGFMALITTSLWSGDGEYRVVDLRGNVLLDHLAQCRIEGDSICYKRWAESPYRRALEAAGYTRARLMRALKRRLGADGDAARRLTRFMEDGYICGVLRPDGSRMEVRGCEIDPCENGLYRVNARTARQRRVYTPSDDAQSREADDLSEGFYDRWGYVDGGGAWVLPPVYGEAYNFVDGAAVVMRDGKYFLIDAQGRRVGGAEWTQAATWTKYGWNRLPGFAVVVDGGSRMVGRRGEFLSGEIFAEQDFMVTHGAVVESMNGHPPVLTDAEGRFCVFDENGSVALRVSADDWDRRYAPEGAIWLELDGKWGLMDLREGTAGQWRTEPTYDSVYSRGIAKLGNRWVAVDENGRAVAPLPDDG